jgi:hypothetical protein
MPSKMWMQLKERQLINASGFFDEALVYEFEH